MLNLNKGQRQKNIKNVFSLTSDVSGKKVLIIDDVFTTGSTLFELGSLFYKSGATEVVFLVLGKTQRNNEKNKGTLLRCGFSLRMNSTYSKGTENFYYYKNYSRQVGFAEAYDSWIIKLNNKMKEGSDYYG